jgi:hypothetical protein
MTTSDWSSLESRDGLHLNNLRRDGLTPGSGQGRGVALRIALAALALVALAVLGSLPTDGRNAGLSAERAAVPGSAPAPGIVLDGHGKWSGYTR